MRKSLFWMMVFAVALVFAATTLQAQTKEDLGALAKKEKARREALEKQKEQKNKEKKVYTNDDIPKIKSQLGIIGSGETGSDQATTEQQPEENQAASNSVDYDKQIQELQDQKDALQAEVNKAREVTSGGGGAMSSNYGELLKSINENEKKMEALDAKIQDLQRQKEQAAQQQQKPQQQEPPAPETTDQQQ